MDALHKYIEHKAYNMRVSSLIESAAAGSGHPTSCLSAADIVAVLFFNTMHFDLENFENPDNDRFILSKGHASALLYAVWKELGKLTQQDLLTYRQFDSVLEGHPTFRFAYTEAATGALGTGLSIAVGQALAAKLGKKTYYTYVLLGDGEVTEGANWEAVQVAYHYKLDNLIAIIDCNRLAQSDATIFAHDVERYKKIFTAFGWYAVVVDGHSVEQLMVAFKQVRAIKDQPIIIIAKTFKGHGIEFAQNRLGFHGKAFTNEQLSQALHQLKESFSSASAPVHYDWQHTMPKATVSTAWVKDSDRASVQPEYAPGMSIATRKAYGQTLAQLGDCYENIVSLDADVKNSTYADIFEKKHPTRFFQCYIAEQNMVGMAIGFARRGYIPFVSTFASFFARAYDHIRMAAIGKSPLRLVGSHAGISIGQDGPSQMALEDIALMRCLPESVVLYPCDAVSTSRLMKEMVKYNKGISYLRTTRMDTPVIYDADELFFIGGCKVLRQSSQDHLCVIGAGITVFEALKAYEHLKNLSTPIMITVIDCYSIKPLDKQTIVAAARAAHNTIITVEDHYIQGGMGEAIVSALGNYNVTIHNLAVTALPRSGQPEELLAWAGIDAHAIIQKVIESIDIDGSLKK